MTYLDQTTFGELALPRPPGVVRRWLATHTRAVDWIIVSFYLLGSALMLGIEALSTFSADFFAEVNPDATQAGVARNDVLAGSWLFVMLASVAVVALALRLRRTRPLAGSIVISAVMFVDLGLLVIPNVVAQVFLLYAVPVYRGVRAAWIAFGIAVLSNTVLIYLTGGANSGLIGSGGLAVAEGPLQQGDQLLLIIMNAMWLLAVLLIGINLGNRRRYVKALIERAHQLAREREQKAQLAAAAERNRIAREMHDIVAHSLSVVVTLSEAAAVALDAKPEAAKDAMQRAAETGRNALVEMRRLLGVLNEPDAAQVTLSDESAHAPRSPQPRVADLRQLVGSVRQAGLVVSVVEEGTSLGDATQQLAVFRVVQEGLTNALRYAGPNSQATLVLEHTPSATHIEITDSGRAKTRATDGRATVTSEETVQIPGSGRGLEGAAERARMFGGTLDAGPYGAGWRLTAQIPIDQGASR